MGTARFCMYQDQRGEEKPGVFHRWGESYVIGEEDVEIPLTIAIVEAEDGHVLQLRPNEIRFADPPEQEGTLESLKLWSKLAR